MSELTTDGTGSEAQENAGPSVARRKLQAMLKALGGADNDPRLHQAHGDTGDGAMRERLNGRVEALTQEREGLRMWRTFCVLGAGATPIAIILTVPVSKGDGVGSVHWVLGACLMSFQIFLLIILLFIRARVAAINANLQILEYENVLTAFKQEHEKRAATLFFKHQAELKQYYDQALRQSKQSFGLGLVLVGFGMSTIVVVAGLLLARSSSPSPAKLAAGGLGVLLALLTGFVGRVFLRVYEESAKALGGFHDRLVSTNDYHFATLLIASIEPDHHRMTALSKLAGVIATRRPVSPARSTAGTEE